LRRGSLHHLSVGISVIVILGVIAHPCRPAP
jgi:hypothetical protein